jgi:DNA helicase-2/ATP-dependent DNA helicase PcrA
MQLEAVKTVNGAVLVLAGAGTGKTRVLTSRVAYIVSNEIADISRILAVTFTNKAANEMKERVVSMLEGSYSNLHHYSEGIWIGTFHSLALRIIRPYHEKFGRSARFSIVDGDDQLRIIKKILKDTKIDDKKYTPKSMAYYINKWKDLLHSAEIAKKIAKKFTNEEIAARVYDIYTDVLISLDAIDFGDILYYCMEIFKSNKEILNYYQEKFKYIMVDEYQDTNTIQYIWLRSLSMSHGNICCVGDDDQSIYSWRGADIDNILKFEDDFKNTKVIRLEQNYRSTGNILNTANGLISNNIGRMKKSLWTESENGLPVFIKSLINPYEEAFFISNLIINKNKNGIKYEDMAILVRTAFQTRVFEDRFLILGIPYKIIGGLRFYDRKEVKDAIAYIRLVVNINDGVAFERIVNSPKRGIGVVSINKFYSISKEKNISLTDAARIVCPTKLSDFFALIEKWRDLSETLAPYELMKVILEESGYTESLRIRNTVEDDGRIETLNELVNSLKNFDNIIEFLDYIGLVLDNAEQVGTDKITISTIHAAKGLEYQTVFIPGFEENIMPHQKAIEEKGDLGIEEERRLCYVAITRAKKETYITFCNSRNGFFSNHYYDITSLRTSPSRFLRDLPKSSTKIL